MRAEMECVGIGGAGLVCMPRMPKREEDMELGKKRRIEKALTSYKADLRWLRLHADEHNAEMRERSARAGAVRRVLGELDEDERELVRLVYFDARLGISGAGLRLYMSRSSAYRHMERVHQLLGKELGIL